MPFQRIAIVNRGEPAMRFINAVAELNRAGGDRLTTIALVHRARPARLVRPRGRRGGVHRPRHHVRRARRTGGADLPRPRPARTGPGRDGRGRRLGGLGLRRRAGRVRRPVRQAGRRLHRPVRRRHAAGRRQDPVQAAGRGRPGSPSSRGAAAPVADLDEASAAAERIGYPLFVKATGGGGGRGIRRVTNPAELAGAVEAARAEARHAFGDPTVFLERQITERPPRRGPGDRRPPRRRVAGRRARLHAPAAPPEGDRGVLVHPARPRSRRPRSGGARPSCAGRRATRARARSSSCTRRSRGAGTSWR